MTGVQTCALPIYDRHFKIISLALLPAIVETFTSVRSAVLRACFWAVAIVMSLYGVASFVQHTQQNLQFPIDERGIRQQNSSQAVIDFLDSIDRSTYATTTLIYLPSLEMALGIRRTRVLPVQADFFSLEELAAVKYRGRVPRLYVLVPSRFVDNGKAETILRSFVDYPADVWTKSALGEFTYYFAQTGP